MTTQRIPAFTPDGALARASRPDTAKHLRNTVDTTHSPSLKSRPTAAAPSPTQSTQSRSSTVKRTKPLPTAKPLPTTKPLSRTKPLPMSRKPKAGAKGSKK